MLYWKLSLLRVDLEFMQYLNKDDFDVSAVSPGGMF